MRTLLFLIAAIYILSGCSGSRSSRTSEYIKSSEEIGKLVTNDLLSRQQPELIDFPQSVEKVYLQTDRTYYYPGNDIWFKAYLIDAYYRTLAGNNCNLHIELISPAQRIISGRIIKIEEGLGNGDLRLPDDIPAGKYRIRAYTNYMRNFSDQLFFNKEITVIKPSGNITESSYAGNKDPNNVSVSFFPEGGSLVDGVASVVAFKAVDEEGRGCEVSGSVYSSEGTLVTMFRSTHLGMGSFELRPVPGLRYFAVVKTPENLEVKEELPTSFSTGVTLSTMAHNDKDLSIIVRTNALTMPDVKDADLKLFLSVRNEILKTYFIRINSLSNNLAIPVADIPEGVVMLTLLTSEDLPLAEKLVYIQHDQHSDIEIRTDNEFYRKRDPVSVKITIPGESVDQETSFLSLSATDESYSVHPGEYPTTISSWFLLESDIRGPIEGPSYYFDRSVPGRLKDLDLLLRTQGWRDFSWKFDSTRYYPNETGFFVSGRLRKINRNRPLADFNINFTFFQDQNIATEIIMTDKSGRFNLSNIDLTGSARLVISALDGKNMPNGLIILDSMNYKPADISGFSPAMTIIHKEESLSFRPEDIIKARETELAREIEIIENTRKKYTLSDTIGLNEVVVTAEKSADVQESKIVSVRRIYGEPDNELIVTPIMENLTAAPELLMGTIPGVLVSGPDRGVYNIRVRSGIMYNKQPLLLIDGIKYDISYLSTFPVSAIDRIDVLKSIGKTAAFGLDGNFGVISVITRAGNRPSAQAEQTKHTINTLIKGYDSPRIFYAPNHDPAYRSYDPDLRTTLFWKPDIRLQKGNVIHLNYYNADNSGKIRIVVEGITSTGIPVTGTAEYEIID